jgi:hypothetical protein
MAALSPNGIMNARVLVFNLREHEIEVLQSRMGKQSYCDVERSLTRRTKPMLQASGSGEVQKELPVSQMTTTPSCSVHVGSN